MVVHLAYSGVGGTGSFVSALCPQLRDRYGAAESVVFYGVEPLHADYALCLKKAGIPFSEVSKRPGLDLRSYWALARVLTRIGADVVVMHGGGTAWHWPLLRLMGVRGRLVLVEHGPESALLHPGSFVRHSIGIVCAQAVIAVSERLAERLRSAFPVFLRSKPLWSIPNGVDTSFFTPIAGARSVDTLLMVGTLSATKDHETLIRALAILTKERSVRLVFAGDGFLRPRLEQLAGECGLRERITFLGNVDRAHLLRLYREAAVFTFSTWGEGSPLSLLEAMSCGLPVVASDVPGVREILAGGECGMMVPPGQPTDMARAIGHILADTESAARLGASARRRVETDYSAQRMTARYQEVLNAL